MLYSNHHKNHMTATYLNKAIFAIVLLSAPIAPGVLVYAAPPVGFEIETVVTGLNLPTDFEYTSDGRIFISEKGGVIRIFENGTLIPTPFITLTDVNDFGDRGLLSMALDPNFDTNGFVYLAYVYENTPGINYEGPKTARLIRVTADGNTAVPGSEVVLLGSVGGDATSPSCTDFAVTEDCIASDSSTHTIDDILFGLDAMLYVSIGDASSFDLVDPLAHRAQNLDSLNGKVLRINSFGKAPSDNPYFNGDPSANRSKVWNLGLRNPFRMDFRPLTGSLYIGDVGWFTSEEVNLGLAGANFGWPCREGNLANPGGYPASGFTCEGAESYDDPLFAYEHDPTTGAGSVTGGIFYTGTVYPTVYQDSYFFGDFAQNWIKRLVLDPSDNLISVEDFEPSAGGPVAFTVDPSDNIAYLSIYTGELRRILYTVGNRTPIAIMSASQTNGLSPLSVFFSSAGSNDLDGDPLFFNWDFGDGSTSTASTVNHTYTVDGIYTATLTVTDDGGKFSTASEIITVGNRAPTAIIAAPENNAVYTVGSTVSLVGVGTDPEDGTLVSDVQFSWRILLHHNVHVHILQEMTGRESTFLGPDHGSDVYIEVELTVTDSGGLTDTTSINMYVDQVGIPAPFHVSTDVAPMSPLIGSLLTITSTIDNTGDPEPVLVDLELYNSAGAQVAQSFYDSEIITAGSPRTFTLDYTPTVADTYRVAAGLIYEGWQGLYEWTNDALTFVVGDGGTNTAPTITVIGANPLNLTVGDVLTDPGASASDSEDGDLTASIVVGGDSIDTGVVGTYTVSYDVTDSGGLSAVTQSRVVEVTESGTWTPIPPNGATFFDGVDDYINTEFWDIEEPIGFTLEARFAANSFNGDTPFIGKATSTPVPSIDWMFGLREVSGAEAEFVYIITADGVTTELTGGSVAIGEFVHASAVYDNATMKIYKNGVEIASTLKTGLIAQDSTYLVWLGNLPTDPTTNAFHGSFDEIRVWNEPQSADEVVAFQGELTQKELGLIKDWRFNEGFGQVVIDKSNSGHHGHLGGVKGAVDDNDPVFLGGIYPSGGTFLPVHTSTIATPNPAVLDTPTIITATVENTGDGAGFMIINLEVYDATDTLVFQDFVDGEGFAPGETRSFDFAWTPTATGTYRVATGLVHLFWTDVHEWVADSASITVSESEGANTPPTITILGSNPLNLTVGDTFTDPRASASDAEDGDLTASIVVGGDAVDTGVVGTYNITYDVTDSGGLASATQTRTVIVNSPSSVFSPEHTSSVATPDPSVTGDTVTTTVSITNTGSAGTASINLELFDEGTQVAQQVYDDEFFNAGETRNFTLTFASTHEGEYGLAVGLFEPGWTALVAWYPETAVFTVYDVLPDPSAGTSIYMDALSPGFSNWSWDTTVDLGSTAVATSEGVNSIEATYTATWGGLYLHHSGFDTTGKTELKFDINGGSAGGQILQVVALDSAGVISGQAPIATYLPAVDIDTWYTVTIPLVDIGILDSITTGVIFQGASGVIEPTFHVDNILMQ